MEVIEEELRKLVRRGLDGVRVFHTLYRRRVAPLAERMQLGVKTVRIFSDRIRDRIHLEGFRYVRIRVWIFNIRYRIRIRILKSHIYDVSIQSYLIRHG